MVRMVGGPLQLFISFEGKINRNGCAVQNLDGFFSHPEAFMPDVELVSSWGDLADCKTSRFIRNRKIGVFEHMDRANHEGMGIASGIKKSRHRQWFQNGFRSDRLRNIDQRRAHSRVFSNMSIM